ncbi:UNVERIFIED_CONTAM: hypothetical protein BEN50_05830 [Euhalothece sp. KZN 001]
MENVKITPRLVDPNGTPGLQEGEIQDGDTFEVKFLFEDLLTDNDVVQAGYSDVLFNPNFVLLQEDGISYGEGYTIQRSGDNRLSNNGDQIGRLSEVGAATGSIEATDNQEEPQLVFTLTFIAQADLSTNPVTIESEKPDQPTNTITLFGNDDEQTDNTEYGELTIGPDVNIIESDGSTDVSEDGDIDTYELVLNSEPSADVIIDVSNVGQVSVEPTSLTFTPGDWDTPQEVTVTADDDEFEEGAHETNITHSIADGSATEYLDNVSIDNVVANITDNDVENQPPEFDEATFTFDLDPNQADQFNETIAASDPNGDDLTFSITEGNDPDDNDTDAFTIDNDGIITVADAAELEGQDVFDLTVEASDGELTSSANVEINLTDGPTPDVSLDINGDGNEAAGSDGVLIFRFLNNIRGDALVTGIPPFGAERTTGEEIAEFLDNAQFLDVNGDGNEAAGSDGVLIFRFLNNIGGDALVTGIPPFGAERTTGEEIAEFLQDFSSAEI